MPAFVVTIKTPLREHKITVNNPPGQTAEGAKAEIERQQQLISDNTGLPLMPRGEITDVRAAEFPKDFTKRPAQSAKLPVKGVAGLDS
jgi:hypothetical protein